MIAPSSANRSGEKISVRAARRCDLEAMVALEEAAFTSERISRRSFQRLIGRPTAFIAVAEKGARLVGVAVLLFRAYSSRVRLYSIAVAADAAGRGIGSGLLRAVEQEAGRRGARSIGLEVRADNAAALRLYERHGFSAIGRTGNYYGDGAAALHLLKRLEDNRMNARPTEAAA